MIDVGTKPAPVEVVTPILPSEAIRLGCLIAPRQLMDDVYVSDDGRSSCVYGALVLGQGVSVADANDEADTRVVGRGLPCPACDHGDEHADVLLHLNDDHRWSRERIADWLAEQGL